MQPSSRFTDADLTLLWKQALDRQRQKDENRSAVKDKRTYTSIDNVQMHYIGLKLERLTSDFLGVPLDTRAKARRAHT